MTVEGMNPLLQSRATYGRPRLLVVTGVEGRPVVDPWNPRPTQD